MYIVIEKYGGWQYAMPVMDEETGLTKVFDTLEEAQAEANECQDGIVIGDNTINEEDLDVIT